MARAIWKGVIRLDKLEVPVKLYSAIEDRGVHFRLLHAKNHEPIKQRMVNPDTGKPVASEDVHKGFEVDPGVFVMLEEEELAELDPEPSRDIDVTRFVPRDAIPNAWFERAYYLGPDGDDEAYFAFARALAKEERVGICTWVMRKKDYAGGVVAHGDYLMLLTLRHAGEVVPASALPAPGGRKPDEREIRMARQLVDALADELDMSEFRDEYRTRVMELVEAKAEGKTIPVKKVKKAKPSEDSLGKLLEASLAKAKERKVA